MYDNGNYVLVPKLKKYCIAREVWVRKDEKEKKKALIAFLQSKKCSANRVYATNVNFSVTHTKNHVNEKEAEVIVLSKTNFVYVHLTLFVFSSDVITLFTQLNVFHLCSPFSI